VITQVQNYATVALIPKKQNFYIRITLSYLIWRSNYLEATGRGLLLSVCRP